MKCIDAFEKIICLRKLSVKFQLMSRLFSLNGWHKWDRNEKRMFIKYIIGDVDEQIIISL